MKLFRNQVAVSIVTAGNPIPVCLENIPKNIMPISLYTKLLKEENLKKYSNMI